MCSMHALEMEVAGKPDASFPTTTNNNNNFVYTNRNAYNQEQMNDHADAQRKESQDSTDSTDGGSQLNDGGLHAGNVQIAATAVREAIPTTTANGNPSCKKIARPSHRISGNLSQTLRALLDAIKKFKRHRRPVNDFLMFCKVHRGKVSAHFTAKAAPKENRFITRKLGLWWGLLTQEQKQPYKLLADKYKAMYLAAFPEYRWGKSQHHQPSEVSDAGHVGSSSSEAIDDESGVELEHEDGNLEAARCLVEMSGGFGLPPLSGFRLADETQMGSLSALLPTGNGNVASRVTMDTESSVGDFEHNYSAAQPVANDGAQDLRVANNRGEPCANMRQHFLAQTRPNPEQPAMSSGSSTGPARATRTCKGKRYEAFMQRQHPTRHPFSPGRNKRPRTTSSSSITITTTTTAAAASVPVAPADPSTSTTSRVASAGPEVGAQDLDERAILAWLSDYDKLNEEIAKLPVFDLNEFLAKQKCDKRRKKPYAVSSKAARKRKTSKSSIPSPSADVIDAPSISSSPAPPPAVVSVTAPPAETAPVPTTPQTSTVPAKIVGCRKRKAPKENIIRNPVL